MEHVASIELEGGGRGQLYIEERLGENGQPEWRVLVELPNGGFEEPPIAPSSTREEVLQDIHDAYDRNWDLVWEN